MRKASGLVIATGAKRPRNDKSGAIAILTLPRTSLRCVAGPGCPCVLHALRGLFPREQQRGEDGEDAARELGRDDGAEHGRVVARREAEVVAEDEGRRDGEGDVHDLAALVHVLYHAEHGDIQLHVCQLMLYNPGVDVTAVKNVKKPAGAKPGMVVYYTYRTAYVTPDAALAQALKAR